MVKIASCPGVGKYGILEPGELNCILKSSVIERSCRMDREVAKKGVIQTKNIILPYPGGDGGIPDASQVVV